MRLLLDQNFPKGAAAALSGHIFRTAFEMGWGALSNGDLLKAAEAAGFEVMLTADRNIRYQQNLAARRLAIVAVSLNNRRVLLENIDLIQAAVDRATAGSYEAVEIPRPTLIRNSWPERGG